MEKPSWDDQEKTEIISRIKDLLEVHFTEIKRVLNANGDEISIGFSVKLDHTSESRRIINTSISFSQKFKDESEEVAISDPAQGELL
jgi:hemerythrin